MISQCCAQQKVLYAADDGGDDRDGDYAFDDGRPGFIAIIMIKTLNMIQSVDGNDDCDNQDTDHNTS